MALTTPRPVSPNPPPPAGEEKPRRRREKAVALVRTCVGCRKATARETLVRWVLDPNGGVVPDLAGKAFGRGAWLHATPACLSKAAGGFSRSFKHRVEVKPAELEGLLYEAAHRRVGSLLRVAACTGKLAVGGVAVRQMLARGQARLLVIACDARAAIQYPAIERAVAEGRAVAWGNKAELGSLLGREEVGVIAVLDDGLGAALKSTVAMTQASFPVFGKRQENHGIVSEVG